MKKKIIVMLQHPATLIGGSEPVFLADKAEWISTYAENGAAMFRFLRIIDSGSAVAEFLAESIKGWKYEQPTLGQTTSA